MPLTHLIHPVSGEKFPDVETAARALDEAGLVPAAVTRLCGVRLGKEVVPPNAYLYPSIMNQKTTCRRQLVLERFVPFGGAPGWSPAMEGGAVHAAISTELTLPDDIVEPIPGSFKECEDGKKRIEVIPGVWMRGKVDLLEEIEGGWRLTDYKTKKWPKGFKDVPSETYTHEDVQDWSIQLSCYAVMIEKVTGKPVKEAVVWRIFNGSHNQAYTFRKFPIPIMSALTLESQLGGWASDAIKWLEQAVGGDVPGATKAARMDGYDDRMFNGKKCTMHCPVREQCFGATGDSVGAVQGGIFEF
jgi:hypothetical protein